MGSAASISKLPDTITAVQAKGAVGCLFDESKLNDAGCIEKTKFLALGAEQGITETSQIAVRNLCKYVKCRQELDRTWDEYVASNGGSDAGLPGHRTFDDKVWLDWGKRQCDPAFVQHRLGGGGQPVSNLAELLAAGEAALAQYLGVFRRILQDAGLPAAEYDHATHSGNVMVAPLKGKPRIEQKAADLFEKANDGAGGSLKYAVVHDVVRSTYLADSVSDADALVRWLLERGGGEADAAAVDVIRLQNRFERPTVTGYRDANLSLRITLEDGTKHVCELQVHLRKLKTLAAELKSHETYELFRSMFHGNNRAVDERLEVMLKLARTDYATCDALAEDAVSRGEELGGDTLYEVAELMEQLGQLAASERVKRWLVEDARPADGEDGTAEFAMNLNNLAQLYKAQGKLDEAEPMMKESLAIKKKLYGDEHPQVAIGLNDLAQLYQAQGKLDEAEPMMKETLVINKKVYGDEHPHVATGLNNLALLYKAQGKLDEAEPLMKESLVIWKKVYGDEHPQVAIGLCNLAQLYQAQGKLDEAEPMMKETLAIDKKVYGDDHPDVASDLNNLARLYRLQGNADDALPLAEAALATCMKTFGAEHRRTLSAQGNLGMIVFAIGDASGTEQMAAALSSMREIGVPETDDWVKELALAVQGFEEKVQGLGAGR